MLSKPEPASPLPWRIGKVKILTGQGYEEWDGILDAKGGAVLVLRDNQEYIVEAANAYPRLKAQLDKALEACRLFIEAREMGTRMRSGQLSKLEYEEMWYERDAKLARGFQLAREALEMAEGRDG